MRRPAGNAAAWLPLGAQTGDISISTGGAALGIGFLLGTAAGAFGYVLFGLPCLALVLVLLLGLIVWAARR